jgi:VEFS-Box of polycomb protein
MDEFDDVTPQAKRFTKLWNRFMKSYAVTADHAIPSKCFDFIRMHAAFLVENDLRGELRSHLVHSFDSDDRLRQNNADQDSESNVVA